MENIHGPYGGPNRGFPIQQKTSSNDPDYNVHAYDSKFVEHGDADAYNLPVDRIRDRADSGFNPDPTPVSRDWRKIVAGRRRISEEEEGFI